MGNPSISHLLSCTGKSDIIIMASIAGAWLPDMGQKPAATLVAEIGAAELSSCLGMCEESRLGAMECGLQCSRSLDVRKRGLPTYVPFSSKPQPSQYVGWSMSACPCASAEKSQFQPDPAAPTLLDLAERNP